MHSKFLKLISRKNCVFDTGKYGNSFITFLPSKEKINIFAMYNDTEIY